MCVYRWICVAHNQTAFWVCMRVFVYSTHSTQAMARTRYVSDVNMAHIYTICEMKTLKRARYNRIFMYDDDDDGDDDDDRSIAECCIIFCVFYEHGVCTASAQKRRGNAGLQHFCLVVMRSKHIAAASMAVYTSTRWKKHGTQGMA